MLDAGSGAITARSVAAGPPDDADVIVDALFGTGLARDVSGPAAEVVRAMNDAATPVLALDVPSGIHSDTGRVLRPRGSGRGHGVLHRSEAGALHPRGPRVRGRDRVPRPRSAPVGARTGAGVREPDGVRGLRRDAWPAPRRRAQGPFRPRARGGRRPRVRGSGAARRRGRLPHRGGARERCHPTRARGRDRGAAARDDGARRRVARRPRCAARPCDGGRGRPGARPGRVGRVAAGAGRRHRSRAGRRRRCRQPAVGGCGAVAGRGDARRRLHPSSR